MFWVLLATEGVVTIPNYGGKTSGLKALSPRRAVDSQWTMLLYANQGESPHNCRARPPNSVTPGRKI